MDLDEAAQERKASHTSNWPGGSQVGKGNLRITETKVKGISQSSHPRFSFTDKEHTWGMMEGHCIELVPRRGGAGLVTSQRQEGSQEMLKLEQGTDARALRWSPWKMVGGVLCRAGVHFRSCSWSRWLDFGEDQGKSNMITLPQCPQKLEGSSFDVGRRGYVGEGLGASIMCQTYVRCPTVVLAFHPHTSPAR